SAEIRETNPIQQKLSQRKVGNEPLYEVESLLKFYEQRTGESNWKPLQAEAMIQAIETAKTRGLNPDDYHRKSIQLLNRNIMAANAVSADQDLLLSDAFFRLAHHLANGKVKPSAYWKLQRPTVNTLDLLAQALRSNNISGVLYSAEPQNLAYQILIETLREYRQMESNGGWEKVSDGPKLFKECNDDRIAALRRRLKVTGEFYGNAGDDLVFDELLDQAVRRFQQTHGLNADGIVGRLTLVELNEPVQERIQQIEANLERMRWISDDFGERHVQINIPAFELTAFVKNAEWLTMRIIVGKSDWQSPVFLNSEITYLETNPYWYVPSEIANKEIWPKVAKNQDYLKKNRLKIIRRSDGSTMLRQIPGPQNSLGRIKIHFANDFGCYLHDTPEKQLFEKVDRAFSHGCIRLENALELSEYLLIGESEWDREKLENTIENDLQKTIYLSQPVPISIVYFTVWIDASSTVQFRKDIYGMDSILAREMARS
ncbi:L,D-transpeptidase family protein, partial [bacterium]|nr:L,D-transpeptidase family protein [bacterium]